MGQIALRPRSGRVEDAARALETLVPGDMLGLPSGRQRYTLFTNAAGGVLDDLMVSNQGDHLMLVVNAARKAADEAHLRAHLADICEIEPLTERALIALQGPRAEAALARACARGRGDALHGCPRRGAAWQPMHRVAFRLYRRGRLRDQRAGAGGRGAVRGAAARSRGHADRAWRARQPRLEAGLCLYGSDLDEATTPVEAALEWAIPKARRTGGDRAGGFPGAEIVLQQLADGAPRRRVGLRPQDRAPVRGGSPLFRSESDTAPAGIVTSGGFGPSLNAPISMGYVARDTATPGTRLFAEVRGKRHPVMVSDLPFVPTRYKR